jgi:membrane carboxypeptidase/penicillin-binding protein
LLELSSAYEVFADRGIERAPYAIEAVVDANGRVIYQHRQQPRLMMSHAIAYMMTGALEQVLRYGTGATASKLGLNFVAAGKTGTTEDYHDAYFVGYTRRLVCGVWVGFDEPRSIGLTGAQAALPAWVSFMKDGVRQPGLGFGPPPPGITMVMVDPGSGGIATPSCPRMATLPFLTGTQPTRICPLHGGLYAASSTAGAPLSGVTANNAASSSGGNPAPQPSPGVATNNAFGALGNFFGSIFGHH